MMSCVPEAALGSHQMPNVAPLLCCAMFPMLPPVEAEQATGVPLVSLTLVVSALPSYAKVINIHSPETTLLVVEQLRLLVEELL